jgi:fatty-acid desaturase
MQGGPLEWVSDHRYHHLHTETALDPHSSYEGAPPSHYTHAPPYIPCTA